MFADHFRFEIPDTNNSVDDAQNSNYDPDDDGTSDDDSAASYNHSSHSSVDDDDNDDSDNDQTTQPLPGLAARVDYSYDSDSNDEKSNNEDEDSNDENDADPNDNDDGDDTNDNGQPTNTCMVNNDADDDINLPTINIPNKTMTPTPPTTGSTTGVGEPAEKGVDDANKPNKQVKNAGVGVMKNQWTQSLKRSKTGYDMRWMKDMVLDDTQSTFRTMTQEHMSNILIMTMLCGWTYDELLGELFPTEQMLLKKGLK
jgi:hypothetical protein